MPQWNKDSEEKFKQMLEKIPVFLRPMAKDKISKKAEALAGSHEVTEKEVVEAFFSETPFGFHGPMKTDMQSLGIDYTRYGYDK